MDFASSFADYNSIMGSGINKPTAFADSSRRLVEAAARTKRDVGAYVLFMFILADTDEEAEAKWKLYNEGADQEALS
jgi:pyrimidine oxygenase